MERSEDFDDVNLADADVSSAPTRPVTSSPRHAVLTWLARISRFFLAALFLFTAGAKLAIINSFVENMAQLLTSSGFDPVRWSWPFTIALIGVEIGIAILLLLPRTVRLGAVFSAPLLIFFAAYALYYVYALKGEPLECGCFGGIIGSQLGVKTALRNLGLLLPAVFVWIGYRNR
jgi:uncharacterized membrane protein YphA (DoxX/SURF4 family)